MSNTKYLPGDVVHLSAEFQDPVTGAGVVPSTVTVKIKRPDTTIVGPLTPTPDPNVIGLYYYDLTVDAPGRWWYGFYSTGEHQTSGEDGFTVARSKLVP